MSSRSLADRLFSQRAGAEVQMCLDLCPSITLKLGPRSGIRLETPLFKFHRSNAAEYRVCGN
jgi:hypothetical protein